jgi:hypothetical protein
VWIAETSTAGCDGLARLALAAQGFDGRDRGCRRRPLWKRATHWRTVVTVTPKAAATAFGVCPSTTTRRTSSARLCGVSRAF